MPPAPEVALVAMPFISSRRPSIQLGLLKAIADARGYRAQTLHLNLELVPEVGLGLYEKLCEHRGPLLGEWLFAVAAFGREQPDPQDRFLRDFPGCYPHLFEEPADAQRTLTRLRHEVLPRYVERVAAATDWGRFLAVGFTSTFQQQAASLALARRIKVAAPHVHIVFGGANHDGLMGQAHLEATPWIDHIVSGEADDAFPALLDALAAGEAPTAIPGVVTRQAGRVHRTEPSPPTTDLDRLPTPDYDEYFARLAGLGQDPDAVPRPGVVLPFETARGCWWGQKHHCTFCGLNGATLKYRSKSKDRVRTELSALARRHRSFHFEAVDNIMDHRYLTELLPELAEAPTSYQLMYEVKANMGRAQVALLQRAGVRQVQPGIESLSTRVLGLMDKGTTAAQNVAFLRWCLHYGVEASWNLLWGFPGESEADYAQQLELLKKLTFLPPPHGGFRIWMERFSPLFMRREQLGVRWMRPERSYAYVYPDHFDLDRLAYFFEYELQDGLPDVAYAPTKAFIRAWQAAWSGPRPPTLNYWWSPGFLQLEDRRRDPGGRLLSFDALAADVYVAVAERPLPAAAVAKTLGAEVEAVQAALRRFVDQEVVMEDGDRFLALALPAYRGAEGGPEALAAPARPRLPVVEPA